MQASVPQDQTLQIEPIVEFIDEVAGIYFRSILLPHAFLRVKQHTHDYDHATYIGAGSVRLWVDDAWAGDFDAGQAVEVKANKRHEFMSLKPHTRLTCVHNAQSAQSVKEKEI